jgi:hypothetical protein
MKRIRHSDDVLDVAIQQGGEGRRLIGDLRTKSLSDEEDRIHCFVKASVKNWLVMSQPVS